jgi:hypothetical protein
MAGKLLSVAELEDELIRRGCSVVRGWRDDGRLWRAPGGHVFNVPMPPYQPADPAETRWYQKRYSDWVLDLIIDTNNLPAAPQD